MLSGKTVLIGITGGIAAYKICDLIRMYKRANANVKVILTQNAMNFVTPLTISNLSQNPVATDEIEWQKFKPEHISLADEADILVIAPASANTISKIAQGVCDNLLTTIVCAFTKPVIIAPAMNCNMWNNPTIEENLNTLRKKYEILEPESGFLACGYEGKGRLTHIDRIFEKTVETFNGKLKGKKIIVTAGGTREKIDPVRYISNCSSGKMGTAIADTAHDMGAEVVLITTKPVFRNYKVITIDSAQEMQNAVECEFSDSDSVIMAAAVADYRVKNQSEQKLKKTDQDTMTLELEKNPDILKEISAKKSGRLIVGFCAESENLVENAKNKIQKKGCDFLIANDISRSDIGFSSDENEVFIIDKYLNIKKIEKTSKKEIARKILEAIYE